MKVGLVPELIELNMYWGEAVVDYEKIEKEDRAKHKYEKEMEKLRLAE